MQRDYKNLNFIAFSDLHIKSYRAFDNEGSRLAYTLQVLEKVFEMANSPKFNNLIVFCGDLFDEAKSVGTVAFNATVKKFYELFDKYPKTRFIAVAGNHDYATKPMLEVNAQTSLDLFPLLFPEKFILLDHYTKKFHVERSEDLTPFNFYGVEFFEFAEEYYIAVENVETVKDEVNILLTHATLTGYDFMKGSIDYTHPCFDRFDLVLSGDIHLFKDFHPKPIIMLGSPIHKDFTDVGQDKYIHMFSVSSDGTYTYTSEETSKWFPRFLYLREGDNRDDYCKPTDYVSFLPSEFTQVTKPTEGEIETTKSFTIDANRAEMLATYVELQGLSDPFLLETGLNYIKS